VLNTSQDLLLVIPRICNKYTVLKQWNISDNSKDQNRDGRIVSKQWEYEFPMDWSHLIHIRFKLKDFTEAILTIQFLLPENQYYCIEIIFTENLKVHSHALTNQYACILGLEKPMAHGGCKQQGEWHYTTSTSYGIIIILLLCVSLLTEIMYL